MENINETTVQSFLNEIKLTVNYASEILIHIRRVMVTERSEESGDRM